MTGFRRIIAAHDAEGRPHIARDETPPNTVDVEGSVGVSELLWLDGPVSGLDDGADRTDGGFPLEPPPGGASLRVIRLPAPPAGAPVDETWLRVHGDTDDAPGMHATDTLDVMVVLGGQVVLGLDHGDHLLGPGDVVVQRGTAHRWRVVGDAPMTYAVLMLRPDPAASGDATEGLAVAPPAGRVGTRRPRRVVTGTVPGVGSVVVSDGAPLTVVEPGGPHSVALVDLWQTGGPLAGVAQGGDAAGWELEPVGGGVSARMVELPAGHDPGEAGWHATDTIDVNLVLSGRLELSLPGVDPVIVEPGQAVVQRGTNHRWRPVGDSAARWFAVMFTVSPHG